MSTPQELIAYAATYEGTFDFMRAMRAAAEQGRTFSPGMLSAIEKCRAREVERTQQPKQGTGLDLSPLPEGTTRHAVKNSEGTLTFVRVDRPNKAGSNWVGWTFVKQVIGPREERVGRQKPGETYEGTLVGILGKVLHDPVASMAAYGREIGECGRCGRRLTDETSRNYGIGPDCRSMLGVEVTA